MLQVGCLYASGLNLTLITVRSDVLLVRSHHKTPLDCWREVDAFKSAVGTEEQVSFRCLTHATASAR